MPKAFNLKLSDFKCGLDFVKSFIKEAKILHHTDANNEERRAKSLGIVYQTENLQPKCLRGSFKEGLFFLTGVIPITRQTYRADVL